MIGNSKFNRNSKFEIQNFNLSSFPKILIIFFLTIFIFQLACLLFLALAPNPSQAADPIKFTPQVQGLDYTFNASDKSTRNIANYIRAIYKYAIGIVGILAAVVLMIGGVMWIVAGGSSTRIGEAKAWISASLTGLLLALMSYLILATINPALVDLKTTKIEQVKKIEYGCCEKGSASQSAITEDECKKNGGNWKGAGSAWNKLENKCITAEQNKLGCCVSSGNTCKDTNKEQCNGPLSVEVYWPGTSCSSSILIEKCQSSTACTDKNDGATCTLNEPQTEVIYECNSGQCNPCKKVWQDCNNSTMKCCVSKGLTCKAYVCQTE